MAMRKINEGSSGIFSNQVRFQGKRYIQSITPILLFVFFFFFVVFIITMRDVTTVSLRFALNIPIIFHKQRTILFFVLLFLSRIIHFVDTYTRTAYWWPLSNGLRRKLSEKVLFWFSIILTGVFFFFFIHLLCASLGIDEAISINAVRCLSTTWCENV